MEFYESFKDFDEFIKEAVENREVMSFPIKKTNDLFENLTIEKISEKIIPSYPLVHDLNENEHSNFTRR